LFYFDNFTLFEALYYLWCGWYCYSLDIREGPLKLTGHKNNLIVVSYHLLPHFRENHCCFPKSKYQRHVMLNSDITYAHLDSNIDPISEKITNTASIISWRESVCNCFLALH
jgi:hypothetical protein